MTQSTLRPYRSPNTIRLYPLWCRIIIALVLALAIMYLPVLFYVFVRHTMRDFQVHDTEFLSTLLTWALVFLGVTLVVCKGEARIKGVRIILWAATMIVIAWICFYIGGFQPGGDPALIDPSWNTTSTPSHADLTPEQKAFTAYMETCVLKTDQSKRDPSCAHSSQQ